MKKNADNVAFSTEDEFLAYYGEPSDTFNLLHARGDVILMAALKWNGRCRRLISEVHRAVESSLTKKDLENLDNDLDNVHRTADSIKEKLFALPISGEFKILYNIEHKAEYALNKIRTILDIRRRKR